MVAIAQWIVLSGGWPRRLVALLAGAVGALAMAPVNSVPAMVVPMSVAVWLIDGAARREAGLGRWLGWRSALAAARVGWWWGFGYFLAGLWWLGAAFLVEPDKDLWAMPFGVVAVPAALALFPAAGFAAARLLWSAGPGRVLALAAGLGLTEWLRGLLFTGFPWNPYGMALGGTLTLAQAASAIGVDGLTLLTVILCAAPATLADPAGRWRRVGPTVAAAACVAALLGYGAHRLGRGPAGDVAGVKLRIMQPDTPQDDSFSYANKDKILAEYLALSERATAPDRQGLKDVTHLIWPESAFPFILSRDPDALGAIAAALPDSTVLVTGAARMEPGAEAASGQSGPPRYFNAIQVVGPGGTVLDSYDKVHLVPFGEYLPFDAALRAMGLTNFVHIPGGFEPGLRRRLLDVPGLPPVAPIVCYEAIFSGAVLPDGPAAARAGVLLNVTNDGWFGLTSGPYQHLAQARLRAIEEGLPLIRAANTGISAIVDPYGRITARLPLGAAGVLDGALPRRLPPTLFARHADAIEPALYLLAFAGAGAFAVLRRG